MDSTLYQELLPLLIDPRKEGDVVLSYCPVHPDGAKHGRDTAGRDGRSLQLSEKRGLRCFLSLETYMACGYGVCNGCTVKVQGPRFKGWPYSRTCMEGPVYEACELVH